MILLDLLYPKRCPVCDTVLPLKKRICKECQESLSIVEEPRCIRCGKPLDDESKELCQDCMDVNHSFDGGRALYEYNSIKNALYKLKYEGRAEYADFYGEEMARVFEPVVKDWNIDLVIPVPIHPSKERSRGYNQASLIGKRFAASLGIPFEERCVVRVKKTTPLKELSPEERQINLKNAFNIGNYDVKLKSIIIVDDIYTTGSTIDAMSRILKAAGAKKIYFATLAIGAGI